jgi:hypothetical protein
MTKSGYFRYAFAKELGYPEAEARDMAMFRSPTLLRKRAAREKPEGSPKSPRPKSGPTALSPEAQRAAAAAEKAHLLEHQRVRARLAKAQ